VTDSEGHQTAVFLPIEEHDELIEDLGNLATVADRVDVPAIPHA